MIFAWALFFSCCTQFPRQVWAVNPRWFVATLCLGRSQNTIFNEPICQVRWHSMRAVHLLFPEVGENAPHPSPSRPHTSYASPAEAKAMERDQTKKAPRLLRSGLSGCRRIGRTARLIQACIFDDGIGHPCPYSTSLDSLPATPAILPDEKSQCKTKKRARRSLLQAPPGQGSYCVARGATRVDVQSSFVFDCDQYTGIH